ncbi:MAG: hypothetical protein R3D34_18695 [Nitratireductor sp.]
MAVVKRVEDNPLVEVHLGTSVNKFEGKPGSFAASLSNGKLVKPGAAILATGFTHFDSVSKPEWGFGTYPDVVTTVQG